MTDKHIDTDAGKYKNNYPILKLSYQDSIEKYKNNLQALVQDCIWFIYASGLEKRNILRKLSTICELVDKIKSKINCHYSNLNIKHISIGGSYLFKEHASSDIDFNIIVGGSYFSYMDIFEIDEINKKLPTTVKKISFMIFGEEDFLRDTGVSDAIETKDYIHTSLCMREGLVFPMRNVLIYGLKHIKPPILDKENLLMRIKRQLYHACLMVDGKIDLHRDTKSRLLKSISRISEALLYLADNFPELNLFPQNILMKENVFSKIIDEAEIKSWLNEANYLLRKLI